jgi:hypothetical protein
MLVESLKPVLFLLGYFALMRWGLPALGISTCLSGSCHIPKSNPPQTPGEAKSPNVQKGSK